MVWRMKIPKSILPQKENWGSGMLHWHSCVDQIGEYTHAFVFGGVGEEPVRKYGIYTGDHLCNEDVFLAY